MRQTVVIDVVGLSRELLGTNTPNLTALSKAGSLRALRPVTPAVTCTVQSTFLTGLSPAGHGAVGNGWYFRDLAQVWLWRQSNHLVEGEKVWETARRRDPAVTCANLFWWFNMYSSADVSVTPRPLYPADGRKIPDIYAEPPALADRLKRELGEFPFFHFWGPKADIRSSQWIAAAAKKVFDWESPSLSLVYLPHLDYSLQRLGPNDPAVSKDVQAVDRICGELITHFQDRGARIVVLSEYGMTPVDAPIHINRVLREAGLVRVKPELGLEALDAGASEAFAVADHQIAHIYVRNERRIPDVKTLLERVPGIERVLDEEGKTEIGLNHCRSGELVAISRPDRWFTYYYWFDDELAPDFARTVDIHRKPGYDPVELFTNPVIPFLALKVGWILLKKNLGFRYLMDVIPLDASLVKGSHGRLPDHPDQGPVLISSERLPRLGGSVSATAVNGIILDHLFEDAQVPGTKR